MTTKIGRRTLFLSSLSAGIASTIRPGLAAMTPTPAQTEGPFYPRPFERFKDTDNDLINVLGVAQNASGIILHLKGKVIHPSGQPHAGALVEIWQCDAGGRYMHSGDRSPTRRRDVAFQGYGRAITDSNGAYSFRTIKPVSYPGRTPHIHFKITSADGHILTTQMYINDEPQNRQDFLFNALPPAARAAISVTMQKRPDNQLNGKFTIVM